VASRPSSGGAASGASTGGRPSRALDLPAFSEKKVTSLERGRRSGFFIQAKENGGVCRCLHVVKHADVPQNLTNAFSRPGMSRKVISANLDVERPVGRPGERVQSPWLQEKGGGANGHRASTKGGIALIRVIKTSQEVLWACGETQRYSNGGYRADDETHRLHPPLTFQ
jgi:hypothetical protein